MAACPPQLRPLLRQLIAARLALGLSTAEVAARIRLGGGTAGRTLNISGQQLEAWEAEAATPKGILHLARWAAALGFGLMARPVPDHARANACEPPCRPHAAQAQAMALRGAGAG